MMAYGFAIVWAGLAMLSTPWGASWLLGVSSFGLHAMAVLSLGTFAFVSWAVLTWRYPRAAWAINANVLLFTLLCLVLSLELTLRLSPRLLGHEFANGVLTKYTARADGIYAHDPIRRMNFMRPNHRTEMYYNGLRWTHQTDAHGFRNPITRTEADLLLLGDSFIYGHGVDIDETVGWFLEQGTRRRVMNLARQGDCALQEAYLLTTYLPQFRPAVVLYFFYENDISDLYAYRTDAELTALLEGPMAFDATPHRVSEAEPGRSLATAFQSLYLVRIVDWWQFQQQKRALMERLGDGAHDVNNPNTLGWRYTLKAIRYMADFSAHHGAGFLIVPITPTNRIHHEILRRAALEQQIDFIDTSSVTSNTPSFWLDGDGHFSAEGAKAMADLISDHL